MLIGYARVSTADQNLELQHQALTEAGCDRIIDDTITGTTRHRPGLDQVLDLLRDGDTLMVWKLDRLGRSVKDLVGLVSELETQGVGFRSLTDQIDTTTPSGRFFFHVMASLAQMERELIAERTKAGLAEAKRRGRVGGRKRKMTDSKIAAAKRLLDDGIPATDVAADLGVSVPTLYRWVPAGASTSRTARTEPRPKPAVSKPAVTAARPVIPPPIAVPATDPARPELLRIGRPAKPWVTQLQGPKGMVVVWSGHTTELGAQRMVASLEKPWRIQPHHLKDRWQWGTAPAGVVAPLFGSRAEALGGAAQPVFDSSSDFDRFDDSRVSCVPAPETASLNDYGVVRVLVNGVELGRLAGLQAQTYQTRRRVDEGSSHDAYTQSLLNLVFARPREFGFYSVSPLVSAVLDRVLGVPGEAWEVELKVIAEALFSTGWFMSLSDLATR